MRPTTKKSRLDMRIPTDLLEWTKKHAEKNYTTVTQLIVNLLTIERDLERGYTKKEGSRG